LHCPSELSERDSLTFEIGTVTEKDRRVEVYRGMTLTGKGIIGGDAPCNLYDKIVETIFIGKDDCV
jgi:hypothetical protein